MQFLVSSLGTVVRELLSLQNTEYSFHNPVPALLRCEGLCSSGSTVYLYFSTLDVHIRNELQGCLFL